MSARDWRRALSAWSESSMSVRRRVLHTRDMHGLYTKLGFGPNERLMERGLSSR